MQSTLTPYVQGLGVKMEIEHPAEVDGLRFKMRLPVKYEVQILEHHEMVARSREGAAIACFKLIDRMQRNLFEKTWHHLEKHDIAGDIESLKRITRDACKLAQRVMRPGTEEQKCIAHWLEYVEHLDKVQER